QTDRTAAWRLKAVDAARVAPAEESPCGSPHAQLRPSADPQRPHACANDGWRAIGLRQVVAATPQAIGLACAHVPLPDAQLGGMWRHLAAGPGATHALAADRHVRC